MGAFLLGGLLMVLTLGGLSPRSQAADEAAPQASVASPGDVVVNEVAYDPTGTPDQWHEWVELYNSTESAIVVAGWAISDGNTGDWLSTFVIPPHGLVIVAADASTFTSVHPDCTSPVIDLGSYIGSGLNNTGDRVELWEDDTLIDAMSYGADTTYFTLPGVAPGHSLERSSPGMDTDSANDWVDRPDPTPGVGPLNTADIVVTKTGPTAVAVGDFVTYCIALRNAGPVTATAVRVTDTLPTAVDLVSQLKLHSLHFWSADSSLEATVGVTATRSGQDLVWEIGDVPPGANQVLTISAQVTASALATFTNWVTVTTAASETITANNTSHWTTSILPRVHLYALAPANYWGSGEAAALINLSSQTVALTGWCLDDVFPSSGATATRVCFPTGAQIEPGQIRWLAQDGDGFYAAWGFDADWAAQAITRPVPTLDGSWPIGFLADAGDEAYVLDPDGNVVDAVAYGCPSSTGTGSAIQGWNGPVVPYPYPGYGPGQILYRKLNQITGLPVPDTDAVADWAQDPDDPIDGRKLRYPGWDLEQFFLPAEVTTTATLTLAVAPEGTLDVISQTVASARHSLRIEVYTLKSVALYQAIADRIQAGVVVTMLLESDPSGGMEDVEKWIIQRLHDPPTSTTYLIGRTAPRYRYQHAKFILVDERLALVSSENLSPSSLPSDPKANGTMGHRGFVAVTDSPGVFTHLAKVFHRDCDPLHHRDVAPYDGTYAPPDGFAPLPSPDWTTYTAPFTAPLVTTASHMSVLQAPENALRDQDGLLGLLSRVGIGDQVAMMQLNEPLTWTTDAGSAGLNPRLQAIVRAARRGGEVRVLLDAYHESNNTETCLALNSAAAQEGLNITCRLANVTGLGVHTKAFLVRTGEEHWIHLGSINGTENGSKRNREVALQFRSSEAYEQVMNVFQHDWEIGRSPATCHIYLPLKVCQHTQTASYPLVSEVLVNPGGDDGGQEWIELYNPGPAVDISEWMVGDATDIGDYGDGRYAFPVRAQLLHGQVIVVAACATNFSTTYGFNPAYEWIDCDATVPDLTPLGSWDGFGMALGNTGDEVLLLDSDGRPIDGTAWGGVPRAGLTPFTDFDVPFPSGASLKRHPPGTDRDDCSRDFYVSYNPSPGVVAEN